MDDWRAVVIAFLLTAGLRFLDYIAPKGHHNKWLRKYAEPDKEDTDES